MFVISQVYICLYLRQGTQKRYSSPSIIRHTALSHLTCDVTPSDDTDYSEEVISTEVKMEIPDHDASTIETAQFSEVDLIEVSLCNE